MTAGIVVLGLISTTLTFLAFAWVLESGEMAQKERDKQHHLVNCDGIKMTDIECSTGMSWEEYQDMEDYLNHEGRYSDDY